MTRSKARCGFRPLIENLESRLQPGSIITGRGDSWSFLADRLVNLDQTWQVSPSVVSEASSEIDQSTLRHTPLGVHSDQQNSAIAVRMAAESEASSLPPNILVDNLPTSLTNDDLGFHSLAGRRKTVPFLPAQPSVAHPLHPISVGAGFSESSVGVTMPAATGSWVNQPRLGVSLSSSSVSKAAAPGNQFGSAPLTLDSPQPVREPALNLAPLVRTVPNLHVTSTPYAASGIHSFLSHPVWASYLGGPGDDRLLGVALNPAPGATQPVVVTGFMQSSSDPTEFDAVLATISTDGTTATITTIGFRTGTRTEGHAVDVDSAGNMYVIGQTGLTSDPNTTTDLIVRMDVTGNVTWAVSLTPAGSTGVGNGIKLDTAGANLYLTGGIDGNLFVAELTDLASAQPSVVYGSVFPLAAGPSVGNAIGPDSTGHADLAFTLTSGSANGAGWGQVTPDGSSLLASAYDDSFSSPKAGMFGITVDTADNFYVAGALGQGASPFTLLVVAKFDSNLSPQYQVGWSLTNSNGVRVADWIGRGIQADSFGNAYVASVVDHGGGGNMTLFIVGPAGHPSLDFQGRAFGTKDDQNRGLALDTTNDVLYMVGFTSSPDFDLTAGSFQSAYGGDPYDGVVIQDRLF